MTRNPAAGFWPKLSPKDTPSTRMKMSGMASKMIIARITHEEPHVFFRQRPDDHEMMIGKYRYPERTE